MVSKQSKEIRSTVTSGGNVELSIVKIDTPTPTDDEVLIEISAAPINPSDLALLTTFGGDLSNINISGTGEDTVASMKVHPAVMRSMESRVDKSMAAGNEGAGIVVDAGANVQGLIGKTVGLAGGSMYSQYKCAPAINCLVMEDGITPAEAASSFVNPLTALSFVETMKMENHSAIVHTAAASNLGQMLIKICNNDGIPLVNIVRKEEPAYFGTSDSSGLHQAPTNGAQVRRRWKYYDLFNKAPGTSPAVSAKGGSNDELHVIVIDEDGLFSGTRGTVLERFANVSKASDAVGLEGGSNFYKDVINNSSKYIWWTDHPASDASWGTAAAGTTYTSGFTSSESTVSLTAKNTFCSGNLTPKALPSIAPFKCAFFLSL